MDLKNVSFQDKENSSLITIYQVVFVVLSFIAFLIAVDINSTTYNSSLALRMEYSIQGIFFIDYFTRLLISKEKSLFFKENIFDLIAIMPFNYFIRLFNYNIIIKFIKLLSFILRGSNRFKKLNSNSRIYLLLFMVFIFIMNNFIFPY